MKLTPVQIDKEVNRIRTWLGRFGGANSTTTRAVAKEILLLGTFFARGELWQPKAKNLGCGVYEITAAKVKL